MKFDLNNRPFELFWRDGKREFVYGDSIANAMSKAGYSQGALPALDFYADSLNAGLGDYFWDGKSWVERESVQFDKRSSPEEILTLLKTHSFVRWVMPTKDEIVIRVNYGRFSCGLCKYAEVYVAHYDGDENDEPSYMVGGLFYFDPQAKLSAAIDAFLQIGDLYLAREAARGKVDEVGARKAYEDFFGSYNLGNTSVDELCKVQERLPL